MENERKLSFLLSGGMNNRAPDELTAPLVRQGEAPALKQSVNTRLGVVPGAVVRSPLFTSITSRSEPSRVRAIVSAAAGRSTLVYSDNDFRGTPTALIDAGRKEPGLTYAFLGSTSDRGSQTGLLPVHVTASRGLNSARSVGQFAQAYHSTTALLYYAYVANDATNGTTQLDRHMVGAVALDGSAAAAPGEVATYAVGLSRWVGMTAHGANGVRFWYQNTAGQVCYRTVSYANGLSFGAENIVLAPGNVTYSIDVVRGDDTYALLAHSRVGVAADGSISKVNITNNSIASTTNFVAALNGGGHVAIQCAAPEGTAVVATVFASTTAGTAVARVHSLAAMALVSTAAAMTCSGRVSVGFNHNDAASSGSVGPTLSVMVERTVANTALAVRNDPEVNHYLVDQATGTWIVATRLPWMRIAGQAAQWTVSAQMLHTVHQLVPRRAVTLENPGEDNYADDPSLDLYWVRSQADNTDPGLLARLGSVRGGASPVDHLYNDRLSSGSLICVGDELYAAYRLLPDYSSAANGAARGRLTTVSLGAPAGQFPTAHDRDGCGFLAAALPLQWDGVGLSEFGGPIHTPQLHVTVTTSVTGALLPAGSYSFQAVLVWTDASGLVHRSRPSPLRTVSLDGATQYVELQCAYIPTALPSSVEARFYATEANGTSLHLMATVTARNRYALFTANGAAVTTANPQIYSGGTLGEEVVPQPPPAAWDVAIIGQRCLIVDAEIRSRIAYSKLRVAGVGYEFTPAFEIILPSGAGDVMAVREWQGLILVLTERAVYQVAGDGPSNTLGGGGSFAAPVKVSDLGCSNTASVVTFPGGIMWQSGRRFVVLDGQGLRYVPDFDCTHDVSAAVCLTRFGEVLFFSGSQAEVRVYHHETAKWSVWDTQTLPEVVRAAHVLPWDADAVMLQLGSGPTTFKRLDADSLSLAESMVIETDWMLLGGDFQDHVTLHLVIVNGRLSGTGAGLHDLAVELFLDYELAASTARSWTSAELDALDVEGRYTLKIEPGRPYQCRALKVRLTDVLVAGAGCSPRSITVVYSIDGTLFEEAFTTGSLK